MTQDEIIEYVTGALHGTQIVVASEQDGAPEVAWGDTFFFYDPENMTPPDKRFPYATIVINDYPGFDEASDLARPEVFRVNMWVSRDAFKTETPDSDEAAIDYTILDTVIPHPVYAAQSWLSVLNPGPATDDRLKLLLAEAHDRARARYEKRASRGSKQTD